MRVLDGGGAVKSRGVLFTAPMVRALLKGLKTQTRRPVKLPKGYELDGLSAGVLWFGKDDVATFEDGPLVLCSRPNGSTGERRVHCPYGKPGERLWVRETWCNGYGLAKVSAGDVVVAPADAEPAARVVYRADGAVLPASCHWRPSLLMPRWASRITLEVERVRIEHVQDISEADAQAEGVELPQCSYIGRCNSSRCPRHCEQPMRGAFAGLWDSIHARRSALRGRKPSHTWADNPLVWAITFRVVPQQETLNTQSHEATT